MRFTVPAPDKNAFAQGLFAVSPNGRYVVFGARGADGVQRLWLRDLEESEPKPLPGTERSGQPIPFWSYDSRYVVYDDASSNNKIKKIDVTGGSPQTISDPVSGGPLGGSWSRDDVVLVGGVKGVVRVPVAGGSPTALTAVDPSRKEAAHLNPVLLPDGKHFLYYRLSTIVENNGLAEGSLDLKPGQQSSRLLLTAINAVYVTSPDAARGAVLFLRDGMLMAQAFDSGRRELSGEPVALAEHVGTAYNGAFGRFSAAGGVLAYQVGDNPNRQLTWYDRNGKVLTTAGEPGRFGVLAMSRDGTKAAVDRTDPQNGNRDVWVIDLAQGTSTRLTFDPAVDSSPVFSPDGSRVVFLSNRGGATGLYAKAANGAGADETLLKQGPRALFDWSPDGRFVIYGSGNPSNIWVLPMNGEHTAFPFFKTQFTETPARLSPDGRFIGYRSDESGRNEIYVKAFTPAPDAGMSAAKWVVSKDGGAGMVHWRRDGKELYYLATNGDVMAVDVSTTPTFHAGTPKALFAVPQAFLRVSATPGNLAAVAPDGQRFLFAMPVGQTDREELGMIVNWQALLKKQ